MYNMIHYRILYTCEQSSLELLCTRCAISRSQGDWILDRLDLLRVLDASLPPHLIHRLHNSNALLPAHPRTFQFPLAKDFKVSIASSRKHRQPHNQSSDQMTALKGKERGKGGPLTSRIHLPHSSASQNIPCPGISHSTSLTSSFLPALTTCGSLSSAAGMNR